MRKIKPSNESEMIYEFLKMELESDRFNKKIKNVLNDLNVDSSIIINGDITSRKENILREEILKRFRGYKNKELFEGFPTIIEWFWTEFNYSDISRIIYINYSYWNELSNYTGSPIEAAKNIMLGKTVYDVPNDNFIKGAEELRKGHKFPPLIFLTDKNEQRYIILEGHGRMTAYGIVPDLFQNVSVLLGYCKSEELKEWYGEMPNCPL
ncbi:MAG: hypothetical protein LBC86_02980 [Oscillospiraceae bacterium]|nr:hypothetical protein [Oscillospiraceae bacterium]